MAPLTGSARAPDGELSQVARSFVVGTAGHIDHGKSALVQALTGTDPDRLQEEKVRGITIDLGFAHLALPNGPVLSFVDVPGHERFVRNMLAGAHGIGAVVLVVAADESVMPQTREHFHICRLLGVPRGLIALTKCDLADGDAQAVAEMEARELVAGSFLEGAPVVRVSARTGMGLDALTRELRRLAEGAAPPSADGLLRLPVDRSFTMRGFGTVVTGTLVSGALATGDEVEVLPSGRRSRVRGLQVHGEARERVEAGTRAAVNLAGLEVVDVQRGDVLGRPGTLRPTSMIDVALSLLAGERPLRHGARVRVHLASAEVLARVHLSAARPIAPGETRRAQLRLERPSVAARGDRLVIRSYSPTATIGGAEVLDPLPRKRRRHDRASADLRPAAEQSAVDAARALVEAAGAEGVPVDALAARLAVPAATLTASLREAGGVVPVGKEPGALLTEATVSSLGARLLELLAAYHRDLPLRPGMSREEARRRLFLRCPPGAFEHVLERLERAGDLRLHADAISLAGHQVRYTPEEEGVRASLLAAAAAAGLAGLDPAATDTPVKARVARSLSQEGVLQRVGERLVHREALTAYTAALRERFASGDRIDVGAVKEMTGLSRKFVIPLLEYLDRERVTRRAGPDRVLFS
jgi:selenocysteine-specific elongation factor